MSLLAGGVEHMSGVPYTLERARWGVRMGNDKITDAMTTGLHCGSHILPYPQDGPVEFFRGKPYIMGHTAEFVALRYGITRQEQDEIALRSHNNVERATNDGSFAEEIVPIQVPQRKGDPKVFNKDEHFRPGLTMAALAKLSPAFIPKTGTVTAGNASGINDGAAALVLMSEERAKAEGLTPLARIKTAGNGSLRSDGDGDQSRARCPRSSETLGNEPRRFRAHRAQRGLCRPVPRLRTGAEAQQGNHQRKWIRYRFGPSGGVHRCKAHRLPDPFDEEKKQEPRPCHPLRRRGSFHGMCHRDGLMYLGL